MVQVRAMITGIGGYGEQIFKALRLANTKYEITGVDISLQCAAFKEVEHAHTISPARSEQYIEEVLELCKLREIQVLFPGTEIELLKLSKYRNEFTSRGILLPICPELVLEICLDKAKTIRWLQENNFYFPKTICVREIEDIEEWSTFPVVLKPSLGGSGSANIFLAQSREELELFSLYLLQIYREFIIQEYVGTPESEYTVGVLFDLEGVLLNSIAVKRNILTGLSNKIKVPNRTGQSKLGEILAISSGVTQGQIGKFPQITRQCEKIAENMGCTGSVNLQCRVVDGKVYVFEINPRFSGTTSFRAMVGYNEPDILVRKYILGETVLPEFSFQEGYIIRSLREVLL